MAAYESIPMYSEDGSRSRDSLDNIGLENEQGQRLLAEEKDEPGTYDTRKYKLEWQLRTCWVVIGSIIVAILVFTGMMLFATSFIVGKSGEDFSAESALSADFRRPSSDYISYHFISPPGPGQ